MSKEIIIENITVTQAGEHHVPLTNLWFKVGKWRYMFTHLEFNTLIAEALNKTVLEDEFKHALAGYLITFSKVYLVIKLKKTKVHKMINVFYDSVKELITKRLKEMPWLNTSHEVLNEDDLFKEHHLQNANLVKLLTGQNVYSIYYNPHLERMKDIIRNYNFCSAIDYTGAIGPVNVTLIPHH